MLRLTLILLVEPRAAKGFLPRRPNCILDAGSYEADEELPSVLRGWTIPGQAGWKIMTVVAGKNRPQKKPN